MIDTKNIQMENVPAFLDKRWISSHFSDMIYLEIVQDKSEFVELINFGLTTE